MPRSALHILNHTAHRVAMNLFECSNLQCECVLANLANMANSVVRPSVVASKPLRLALGGRRARVSYSRLAWGDALSTRGCDLLVRRLVMSFDSANGVVTFLVYVFSRGFKDFFHGSPMIF